MILFLLIVITKRNLILQLAMVMLGKDSANLLVREASQFNPVILMIAW